jgi:hypothetical protein
LAAWNVRRIMHRSAQVRPATLDMSVALELYRGAETTVVGPGVVGNFNLRVEAIEPEGFS